MVRDPRLVKVCLMESMTITRGVTGEGRWFRVKHHRKAFIRPVVEAVCFFIIRDTQAVVQTIGHANSCRIARVIAKRKMAEKLQK